MKQSEVREAREAAGLTREALAIAVGISVQALRNIEIGVTRAPRKENMAAIEKAITAANIEAELSC